MTIAPTSWSQTLSTAFLGSKIIATGALKTVALVAKQALDAAALDNNSTPVLIFSDATSDVIELDWRGTETDFLAAFEAAAELHDYQASQQPASTQSASAVELLQTPVQNTLQNSEQHREEKRRPEEYLSSNGINIPRSAGRPKLGVVAREVTLLPRHWEWLASQTGGASVALRKLVEVARKESELKDRIRHACAVTYKFMSTMAGHEPGFEEASRALFAQNRALFEQVIKNWPSDVNLHLQKLSLDAFEW